MLGLGGGIKLQSVSAQPIQPIQSPNLSKPFPIQDYKQRLNIDPEVDLGSILKTVKQKIVDFALEQLGVERFLTELHSSMPSLTGNITTFLDGYGITISKGKLGIPNVQEARLLFDENTDLGVLNDNLGGQTGATYSNREKLYQEYLQQLSEEYSNNTALSLEGQSKIEAKIDSATSSAEQSLTIAEDSNGQDVSQNILRNISNQFALDQQVNVMKISDMQSEKVDRSLALQMQSQALKEISGSNARELRDSTASNNAVISTLGLITFPGLSSTDTVEVIE